MSSDDRPREKMMIKGVQHLSNEELIAIIIGTGHRDLSALGLSVRLISKIGGFKRLANARHWELIEIEGIGDAKACQICAAFELGKRNMAYFDSRTTVASPDQAAQMIIAKFADEPKEVFGCMMLNTKSEIIAVETISIGTLNASLVHPREVFNPAIKGSANSILIFHNHPSGNPKPSLEDEHITKRLKEAGDLLGIAVVDHIIVGGSRYFSMKEHGYF